MRRLSAIILLFPLMSLLAGAVWVPSHCPMAAKRQCPMMAKMEAKCRMAMMMRHKKEMEAKSKASRSQGKEEKNGGGTCCVDCPVFCSVTFSPVIGFELGRTVAKKEYTVVSDNNLSDYYKQHWKPPSGWVFS